MVDTFSIKERSSIMRKIKSQGTSPELKLRKALWDHGIRGYRIQNKEITGNPDIIFKKKKIAVFVDGCFWHRCERCYRQPKSNIEYWEKKIRLNVKRDLKHNDDLKKEGWRVIRIWEHEINSHIDHVVSNVISEIENNQ